MKCTSRFSWVVVITLSLLLGVGCSSSSSGGAGAEGQLSVAVSALTGAAIADACYRLSVVDGAGDVVWLQDQVCGASYGHVADVSYVGTCDATSNDHTVTLELLSLATASGEVDVDDYVNPCPPGEGCSQTVTCLENADVQVPFEVTIMLAAEMGFVDVAVDVDFEMCSAKLDCVDEAGAPLELLHDASGDRGQTLVVAMACLWDECPDGDFYFYRDDITITCDEGTATVSPIGSGAAPIAQTADILFGAAIYAGETMGSGAYQNLALGLTGGTNCTLETSATVSAEPLPGNTLEEGSGHPAIRWSLPLTGPEAELICGQHPLDGPAGDVATFWPVAAEDRTFDHELVHEPSCAEPCEPGDEGCAPLCPDDDSDGVTLCDGDCDDTNPDIFPGSFEVCGDALDNDCNGLVDCADAGCAGAPECAFCGDGSVDAELGEVCDDGNADDGDGCSSFCSVEAGWECLLGSPSVCALLSTCGDGIVEGIEACDDGNTLDGDGCPADCSTIEAGWACTNALNLNTGSDGAGGQLPLGSDDPIWQVAEGDNCGASSCPAPASVPAGLDYSPATTIEECVGSWHDAAGPAQWVNSSGWDDIGGVCAPHPDPLDNTHRYYRAQFVIPTEEAAAVTTLSGTLHADNLALRIWINGIEVTEWAPSYGDSSFVSGTGVAFGSWGSAYYQAGLNEMVILVVNYASPNPPNPEGLLVEVPDAFDIGSLCSELP